MWYLLYSGEDWEIKKVSSLRNISFPPIEIPVKGDQQKGKGNFLKKTVKKVIRSVTPTQQGSPSGPSTVKVSRKETSSKDLMKSPSPQNETVKAGKNLVPRETKASFLRKQAQLDKKQVSVDKKKASYFSLYLL